MAVCWLIWKWDFMISHVFREWNICECIETRLYFSLQVDRSLSGSHDSWIRLGFSAVKWCHGPGARRTTTSAPWLIPGRGPSAQEGLQTDCLKKPRQRGTCCVCRTLKNWIPSLQICFSTSEGNRCSAAPPEVTVCRHNCGSEVKSGDVFVEVRRNRFKKPSKVWELFQVPQVEGAT